MDISKHIPKHKQPNKVPDVPGSFPSGNREEPARKVETIEGPSRCQAAMQIEGVATEFRRSTKPRPTLHLPGSYRARGTSAL